MPRFNWRLLLDKRNDKKILVIGSYEDARQFCAFADRVYLLVEESLPPAQASSDGRIMRVSPQKIANVDCNYVVVFHPDASKKQLQLLRLFSSGTHHLLHYYKDSTLRERLGGCIAVLGNKDSLLYFPYSSFEINHFTDLFRRSIRLNQLMQLFKHVLRRKEFGLYLPKSGHKSNIENILEHIRENCKLNITTPMRFRNGTTGSFLADLGQYIVRVPYTESANAEFCKNNFAILGKFKDRDLPFPVPSPVAEGVFDENHYYIETKIQGKSLDLTKRDAQDPRVIDAIFSVALDALCDPRMNAGRLTEKYASEIIQQEMRGLVPYLSVEQVELYNRFGVAFRKLATQFAIPLVITHGDFKNANFIICEGENPSIRGVIDWEFSPLVWLPLYDFLVLLVYRFHFWEKGPHELVQFVFALSQGKENREQALLNNYLRRLGVDKSLALPLMVVSMLRHMNVCFFDEYAKYKNEKFWSDVFTEYIDPMARMALVAQNLEAKHAQ